jgi:hypothetical protein
MKKNNLLIQLMILSLVLQTAIHSESRIAKKAIAVNESSLIKSQAPVPQKTEVKKKEDHHELHDALISLDVIKALIILSGCVFTAIVSMMGEALVKRVIEQIKNIVIEIVGNQQMFNNISSLEIAEINAMMERIRHDLKAVRISLFKFHLDNHSIFLEVASSGKHSMASRPPISKHFFDSAIKPMIDNKTSYSYCGSEGEVCSTWLSSRDTGRYAIYLFYYKENFAGFILVEWSKSFFENWFFNEDMGKCEPQLKMLSAMINEAIKDKN